MCPKYEHKGSLQMLFSVVSMVQWCQFWVERLLNAILFRIYIYDLRSPGALDEESCVFISNAPFIARGQKKGAAAVFKLRPLIPPWSPLLPWKALFRTQSLPCWPWANIQYKDMLALLALTLHDTNQNLYTNNKSNGHVWSEQSDKPTETLQCILA